MNVGKCKLCHQEKLLIDKAHIIPDWMYFGLFDEKHKTALISLDEKEFPKRPSSGIYDPQIFCESCDNEILGSLENYGRHVLFKDNAFMDFFKSDGITTNGGLDSAHLFVDDYVKFKLFLVSLIWKMHISNSSFFKNVDLGLSHYEQLRLKILNHEKIKDDDYEVAIVGIREIPDLITRMIIAPKRVKHKSNTYYVSLINGLFFLVNISSSDKMDIITKSKLRENGRMTIPLLSGDVGKLFYDSITGVQIRRTN